MLEYAACMRDHGVDVPDPRPGGGAQRSSINPGEEGAPSQSEFDAASEACQSILDKAGLVRETPSAEDQAKIEDKLLEVAQCMRDRGYDFADPGADGTGGGPQDKQSEDEGFRADLDTCSEDAGLRGAAGGPQSAGGG